MGKYADIETVKEHILAVCVSAKFGHGLFTTTKALDLAIKDIPTINIKEYADKDQAYMEGYAKGVTQGGLLTGYGLGCKTWTKKENTPSVVPSRAEGEWIIEIDAKGNTYGRCTICGMKQYAGQLNYCPNCGAKMKGAGDD